MRRCAAHEHLRAGFLFLIGALTISSCTAALWSSERQCETSGDCARLGPRFVGGACESGACVEAQVAGGSGGAAGSGAAGGGGGVDEAWGCVGATPSAGSGGAAGGTIEVVFRAVGSAPSVPLEGAKVQLCTPVELDVTTDCDALKVAPQDTDATGATTFARVPRGFNGYFRVTRADIRTLLYFPGVLSKDVEELTPVGGLTNDEYALILKLLAGDEGPARPGAAVLYVKDCRNEFAPGVRFSARGNEDALPFYVNNRVPVLTETQTTESTPGQGGFLNLPGSATVTFEAVHVATGTKLPTASAFTVPDTLTVVMMDPRP